MAIKFICDFCGAETENAADTRTCNLLHLAKDREGKDCPSAGTLLPTAEYPDYCLACYGKLKDWLEGDVTEYLRDNSPLKKDDDNAG
jgi:hypothetical protein